jgi:hypothetical protein
MCLGQKTKRDKKLLGLKIKEELMKRLQQEQNAGMSVEEKVKFMKDML